MHEYFLVGEANRNRILFEMLYCKHNDLELFNYVHYIFYRYCIMHLDNCISASSMLYLEFKELHVTTVDLRRKRAKIDRSFSQHKIWFSSTYINAWPTHVTDYYWLFSYFEIACILYTRSKLFRCSLKHIFQCLYIS